MRTFTVKLSDIERCPSQRMVPSHFRDDGTCYCDADGKREKRDLERKRDRLLLELASISRRLEAVSW